MNPPWWKRLLSYLVEWHIESAPSPHNPHLYVSLVNGRYQLSTARAVYSHGDLYHNFTASFRRIPTGRFQDGHALLLGLGLGSIPWMLEKRFSVQMRFTAVEIDESIIGLAEKYVLSDLQSSIQTYCADARTFVAQCREQFDFIAMDVFIDDRVPEKLEELEFLRNLRDLIRPGGLLFYNRMTATPAARRATELFFSNRFAPVFPQSTALKLGSNWMLVNDPNWLT